MNTSIISVANTSKTCRICLDADNQADIIRPCLCSGGSAYVHRKCLDDWRSLNEEGRGFKFCEVCRFQFVIEPVADDPDADRKRIMIFRLLVTRDITFIILLVQALIIGLAFVIQACDSKTKAIRQLFPEYMSSFGVYYLSGLVIFLALLGLFGLIGLCWGCVNTNERNRVYDDDPCGCNNMQCFVCCYACSDCRGGDCDCDCKGGGGEGFLIVVVAVVVIFAIIGIFVGVILSAMIIQNIIRRHSGKLWLKQQTKKYVVKDFEGNLDELKNISTTRPMTASSVYNPMNINTDFIRPSAPVEIFSTDQIKYKTDS